MLSQCACVLCAHTTVLFRSSPAYLNEIKKILEICDFLCATARVVWVLNERWNLNLRRYKKKRIQSKWHRKPHIWVKINCRDSSDIRFVFILWQIIARTQIIRGLHYIFYLNDIIALHGIMPHHRRVVLLNKIVEIF